ncbi:MAG: class I SAM-dependent methyltransferase [Planctomycetia bacterium]|nr:class I SAM-dependent methyltransferase [Planctomycetia bacterium]
MQKLIVAAIAVIVLEFLACLAPAQAPVPAGGGRQAEPPRPSGDFRPPAIPLMTALDKDQNGEISAAEIQDATAALKKLDANGDGKLSGDELRPRFAGRRGPGSPDGPGGPPSRTGRRGADLASSFDSTTLPKDDAEKKALAALAEIQQEQGRRMNVPDADGRLLRLFSEAMGAKNVVEIGTSNGISAIWMAMALRKTDGKLVTYEIDPDTVALARKNFEKAGVADVVTVVEGNAHETVSKLAGPIDLVFIDADKQGYLDYLEKLLPLVRPGGLILAHNMNPRMADERFVEAITKNPELETLFYLEGGGMSISMKKR